MKISSKSFPEDLSWPFSIVKTEIYFHIAPCFSNNIELGIKEQLNSKYLLKYSNLFKGVPGLYRRVKIPKGENCQIFHENPFLHLKCKVEFVVFTPRCGNILRMSVNKQSEEHIGGLVFGIFNATIGSPYLTEEKKAQWDSEKSAWIFNNSQNSVQVGSQITFEVDWAKHAHEILVITGKNPRISPTPI